MRPFSLSIVLLAVACERGARRRKAEAALAVSRIIRSKKR
jgi:hypothetical protein